MDKLLYILMVILFLVCFIKIEIYLWQKSREKFLEAGRAWKELKESKDNLYNLLKDKEL